MLQPKEMYRLRTATNMIIGVASAGMILLAGCRNKDTLFSAVSPEQSHIEFTNQLPDAPQLNILYHIYYYNGGGVALGDINNDGLTDIYFTANSKGANKLYLNKGNWVFEDITATAGVAGTSDWYDGVTMADVNGDGYLDIYVCALSGKLGLKGHNELFINNGNNTFTESGHQYGLDVTAFSQQAAFFDYDNDGDLDCFVLNQSEHPFSYIVDTSYRNKPDSFAGDRLFRNDLATTGRFTDVSHEAGIWQSKLGFGLGLAVADVNQDGWDDIYVSNDFHENDYYYVNQKDGTFRDEGPEHFRHYSRFSMGNDIADYNNDGQPDIVTVDMLPPDEKTLKTYGSDEQLDIYRQKITANGFQQQFSHNALQRNNGRGGSFSDVALMSGVSATDWSWGPLLADYDNDGYKDLLVTNGIPKRPVDLDYVRFISDMSVQKTMNSSTSLDKSIIDKIPDGAVHIYGFRGSPDGRFDDESAAWGLADRKGYFNGAAYGDLDNDGDLDIVINSINEKAVVYRNNSEGRHYLTIQCKGTGANRNGIGARVWLFHNGHLQYQQLMLTRGFQSSSEPRLHFGLDSLSVVDSLLVVWPGGNYQLLRHLQADRQLTLDQANAQEPFDYDRFFPPAAPLLTDASNLVQFPWKHQENRFNDFNVQYLIPHKQSMRGPHVATADVNKDGLDDLFLCGAAGQPGALMLQDKQGHFIPSDLQLFAADAAAEDVDAAFFDANGDGYPDLYVVSGGNEKKDGDPTLADRLYLNDGAGHFSRAAGSLPDLFVNKTTVAVADVDHDGDEDLFVGGFAPSNAYGMAQPSYLLLNDGKGHFTGARDSVISLNNAGMVTSAVFTDLNKDGWPDLVIAGEWMPIKVFLNMQGNFHEVPVPHSSGIWQTLYVTDLNHDGFPDLLAGNWGHNTKLWAGKNGPCKLYVKDFDQNGSVEQVMCYTIDGKEYTFLAKDELERSLPTLKKGYLTYSEVAGKTVQYLLYNLFEGNTALEAEVLGSSWLLNDGKGNFVRHDLPNICQEAPVFSFSSLASEGEVLAAGNFSGVIPYEGQYDALEPTIIKYDDATREVKTLGELPWIDGEVRDIRAFRDAAGSTIWILARNNAQPVFLTMKQ